MTYIRRNKDAKMNAGGWGHKQKVFLVERGGAVRSTRITGKLFEGIKDALHGNIATDANLMPDDFRLYLNIAKRFSSHNTVNHSKGEYGRGPIHTNTIEAYFSVFKRGMKGVYQHCSEDHLQRYLTEFDFRYNDRSSHGIEDGQRVVDALKGIEGKRLTYRSVGV